TFTSMSRRLSHFMVRAYFEEIDTVGIFLISEVTSCVQIADIRNMEAMRATDSHDLLINDASIPEENIVEIRCAAGKQSNGWILHIFSTYLGIEQAARDYAVDFAKNYSPASIDGVIGDISTVQQNVGKMESLLLSARHFLWSTAALYNQ